MRRTIQIIFGVVLSLAGYTLGFASEILAGIGWVIYQVLRIPLYFVEGVLGAEDWKISKRFPQIELTEKSEN